MESIIIERDRRRREGADKRNDIVVPRSSKVAKSPELYRSGLPELSQFVVMVSHKVGPRTAPPRQFFGREHS